jgi:hypothetical protein
LRRASIFPHSVFFFASLVPHWHVPCVIVPPQLQDEAGDDVITCIPHPQLPPMGIIPQSGHTCAAWLHPQRPSTTIIPQPPHTPPSSSPELWSQSQLPSIGIMPQSGHVAASDLTPAGASPA